MRHKVRLTDDRRELLLYLAAAPGPVDGETAAGELGWSLERWWRCVDAGPEYFTFDMVGRSAGWVLTDAGLLRAARERGVRDLLAAVETRRAGWRKRKAKSRARERREAELAVVGLALTIGGMVCVPLFSTDGPGVG